MNGVEGPLAGINIVDLARARSGPTCVRQLVDLGADAVQVLGPGDADGTDLPGSDSWNLHRGKRSIVLDLRVEADYAAFLALVDRADVLVENFRPSVKHRLRIDPETLWQRNERLVYASISGFGQDGPYAERPGVDQIAQGLGGLMSVTGPPGSGPWRAGIAVSDTAAGTFLTQGVLAALYARERTGRGQWVHTSLLESVVNFMDFQAARYLNEGDVPGQAGNDHPTLTTMGTYKTADGWVNIAALGGFDRFCAAIDAPHLLDDERFTSAVARSANRDGLRAAIELVLVDRSTADWIARFTAADLPCGPVLSVDAVFADPQVRHLQLVETVERPGVEGGVRGADGRSGGSGVARVLRHPVTLSHTPARVRGPVPIPGGDTTAVLDALL